MTSEEARQMIEAEKRQREADCFAEIRAVLEKHNCALIPVTVIRGDDIRQTLEVTAN
ncbi:hypothetical protein KC887_01155 [Candidatus Kaiserbacteria bacterium]|nr:hypothetical protein [Candidatus Kaiserbacteria bacterium]